MPTLEPKSAADTLASFKEEQMATDFDALTESEQLAILKQDYSLRLKAEAEQKAQQEQGQADNDAAVSSRLQAVCASLVSKGYAGDGSLADFTLLFERDKARFLAKQENYFGGKDPQELATAYFADGTNAIEKLSNMVQMYDR